MDVLGGRRPQMFTAMNRMFGTPLGGVVVVAVPGTPCARNSGANSAEAVR
jgi:hypothetical protein